MLECSTDEIVKTLKDMDASFEYEPRGEAAKTLAEMAKGSSQEDFDKAIWLFIDGIDFIEKKYKAAHPGPWNGKPLGIYGFAGNLRKAVNHNPTWFEAECAVHVKGLCEKVINTTWVRRSAYGQRGRKA